MKHFITTASATLALLAVTGTASAQQAETSDQAAPIEITGPPTTATPIPAQPAQPAQSVETVTVAAPPPPPPTAIAPPATMPPPAMMRRVTPYHGGPIPPYAHLETRPRTALAISGGALFGALWIGDAVVGLLFSGVLHSSGWLAVPVFGPIIWAATEPGLSSSPASVAFLAVDAIAQAGGVVMFAVGMAMRTQVVVLNPGVATNPRRPLWAVVPGAPGATFGASFVVAGF